MTASAVSSGLTSRPKEASPFGREYESGKRSTAKILKHSFVLLLVLGLGYVLNDLLLWVGDPFIWDVIPWRYAADGADVTIIVRTVITIWKELANDE